MKKDYYYSIDFFKAIAAFCVVLIHLTTFLPANNLATFGNYYIYRSFLDIAVPFFFLTSGFFLGKKILNKNDLNFIIGYLKKVVGYYVIFSAFYLLFKLFLAIYKSIISDQYLPTMIVGVIKSITFKSLLNGSVGSFHLWFLASLIYACAILYLLLRIKLNEKFILVLTIFAYLLYSTKLFDGPELFQHGSIMLGLLFVNIGFYLSRTNDISKIKYPVFYSVIFGLIYFASVYIQWRISGVVLAIWGFYLLIVCMKYPSLGKNTWLIKLSKYSLAIYILHIFVRDVFLQVLIYLNINQFYTWYPYYIIGFTICIIVPVFIYNPMYSFIINLKNKLILEK
jgi:peptidoglycan/LPS O-acetylase OafA/YrhL